MGGPGSGGYKNSPGDTETHAAWDIIQPESDSTQVSFRYPTRLYQLTLFRNLPRYDASIAPERWLNIPLVNVYTSSSVNSTSMP